MSDVGVGLMSIFNCARPLLFENKDATYPYSIIGTAFIVRFRGRHFIVSAAHLLRNFEAHQVRFQYHPSVGDFVPWRSWYCLDGTDRDDPDQYDLVVSEDRGGPVIDFPPYTIPASVKPGDGGVLIIGTLFSDSSRTSQIGTVQISFSVAVNTATADTFLVTFTEIDFDNNNVQTDERDRTFKVDTKGNFKHVKDKIKGKHNGHQKDVEEDDD